VTSKGSLIAALKIREVMKISQGCRSFNCTTQYPLVRCPAVHILPVPLMKRKLFRVGQINSYVFHPPHSGHIPLSLDKCSTHLYSGPRGKEDSELSHIMIAPVHLVFSSCILLKLSCCWLCRLIDIITVMLTVLMKDLCPYLTLLRPKCMCFWR
jgi:hypothetical protein